MLAAKRHYPDKAFFPDTTEGFHELVENGIVELDKAYETLIDRSKRKAYDATHGLGSARIPRTDQQRAEEAARRIEAEEPAEAEQQAVAQRRAKAVEVAKEAIWQSHTLWHKLRAFCE